MLYYDRIDISEGIDIDKTSARKKCNLVTSGIFLNKGFKFQLYVCNRCCNSLMMSMMNLSDDVAILKLKMLIIIVLLLKLGKVKL